MYQLCILCQVTGCFVNRGEAWRLVLLRAAQEFILPASGLALSDVLRIVRGQPDNEKYLLPVFWKSVSEADANDAAT